MFNKTDRLIARRLSPSDGPAFRQISTQPHILRWMPDWDIPAERAEALVAHFINGYAVNDPERYPFLLALWHKTDERMVGICGFGPKEELGGPKSPISLTRRIIVGAI